MLANTKGQLVYNKWEISHFPEKIFKKINGVAMGTKMGPNYANLFVGHVEEQIFNQFDGPKPELFGRYIDDCLGATSCTKEELERFIG